MEQAQPNAVLGLQHVEQAHQRDLGAIQLPVAGEEATVLVAVAVAEHDLLLAAAARRQAGDAGQREVLAHDRFGVSQVANRLEQRHDDQLAARSGPWRGDGVAGVQRAVQQAHLLEQQQHFQQVAHVLGVRDDAVADRGIAVAAAALEGGLEDGQFAARQRGVLGVAHHQAARVAQLRQQAFTPRGLGQRQIVGRDAGLAQQLRDHLLVLVGALAQIDGGQVKAEHLHGAHQRRQPRGDQRVGVVAAQRGLDGAQIGEQLVGVGVGRLRCHRVAQCLGAGQRMQGGSQARVHADQRTAVRFVLAVRVGVGRSVGQREQGRGHLRQGLRNRELGAQQVHLGQVEPQHRFGLAREGMAQRAGVDVGVAVAVAADPMAHAQERGHAVARQRTLEFAIQARYLAQESARVVAERVFDLVGHAELGGAQHARLPQLGHTGAQQRLVFGAFTLGAELVALRHQLGDGVLGVENALALHLGGVGGQHRRDHRVLERPCDVAGADAGALQARQAEPERTLVQARLAFVVQPAPHMVAVFRDVGQVREVAEGPDHADRLVARQVLQQAVEHPPGAGILLQPVGHRQPAHALDQLERFAAILLANHVTQDPAQQPDIFDQGLVLRGRVGLALDGVRCCRRLGSSGLGRGA